jgi:chromosome segregation ATPase
LIEQALTFAIGFLAAALAAVAAAPLLSRRAMRLAVQRARLRAPVSEKQAIADMDALRGEHAVEQARVERRLRLAEEASQTLRAAAGRQAVELIQLRGETTELNGALYDQRAEAEALGGEARALRAAMAAAEIALNDAFAQRNRAEAQKQEAQAHAASLDAEASRRRARLAVMTARVEYLEGRLEDLAASTTAARARADKATASLEAERGRAAALEARLAAASGESQSLADRLARGDGERREHTARFALLEERLRLGERAREEMMIENGRRLATIADLEAGLAVAKARAAEAHARENAAALRAETLAAAQGVNEGTLKAARADRDALAREIEALRANMTAGDAELRGSIARLGHEMTRLFFLHKASDGREGAGEARVAAATAPADGETIGFSEGSRRRVGRSLSPDR